MSDQRHARDLANDIAARLRLAVVPSQPADPAPEPASGCEPWCGGLGARRVGGAHLPFTDRTASLVETYRTVAYDYCRCAAGTAARERHAAALQALEEQQAQRVVATLWDAAELPPKLRRYTLDSYLQVPGARASTVDLVRRWQRVAHTRGRNLLLRGGPGTAKTGLGAALVNEELAAGRSALYVVAPSFLTRIRSTYRSGRDADDVLADETAVMASATRVGLLMLDDVGAINEKHEVVPLSPWGQEKLFTLVNERDVWERPTIITTNLTLAQLEAFLGPRTFDRIRGNCDVDGEESYIVHLTGESRRGMQPTTQPTAGHGA